MSNSNGNTPAAPFTRKPEYQFQECGLTKREHFAGLIAQGLLAGGYGRSGGDYAPELCARAVSIADSLIAELDK